MKTYVCVNCGAEVRRPTAPLSCQACGQQRIGLFKVKPAGAAPAPAAPGPVAPAAAPLPPPGPVLPQPAAPTIAPAPPVPGAPGGYAPARPAAMPPAAPRPPVAAPVTPVMPAAPAPVHVPPAPVPPAAVSPAPVPPAAPAAPPVAHTPVSAARTPRPAPPPASVAAIPLQPAPAAPLRPPVPTVPAFNVTEEGEADVVMLEAVAGPSATTKWRSRVGEADVVMLEAVAGGAPSAPDITEDEEPTVKVGLDEPREAPPEMADVPPPPSVTEPPRGRRPTPRRPGEPHLAPAALYSAPAEPAEPEPVTPPVAPPPARRPAAAAPRPAAPAPPPPPPEPAPTEEPPAAARSKPASERRAPGTIMWQYPKQIPGQAYSTAPIRCCPAVFGKNQFAACIGPVLVGLDWKGSGLEKMWECNAEGHIPGSPVLGSDGLIRMHSGDGWLHCIDQNGGRVWEPVPVGEPLGWASPLVDGNGNTYISSYTGGIFKVSPRGDFKNTPYFRSRQKFDSTGVIYRGVLYIGCEDAFVYAIQLSDTTGKNVWDHLANRGKTEWFINSAIALAPDSTIVVAGRDEHLYGFNQDGKQVWKVHIPGQMLASPVIAANGDVLIGISLVRATQADQGKLVCVDGETHRVRWEYEAKGAVESTPVIGDDDIVYFGDNTGHIHAVRLDGTAAWRQHVKLPVRSAAVIVGANRLVFGLDNGTLVGLLCSSGGVAPRGWPKYLAK